MKSSPNKQANAHVELILELYTLIPSSYKITLSELHQRLQQRGIVRSKRTIQRSLDVITQYFDIEKDERSKPFGYRKNQTGRFRLKAKEAVLLKLVSGHFKGLLPKDIAEAFEAVVNDAEHYLSNADDSTDKDVQWLSKVHLLNTLLPSFSDRAKENFNAINDAIYNQRALNVQKSEHGEKLRAVPLGILVANNDVFVLLERGADLEPELVPIHNIYWVGVSTITTKVDATKFHRWLSNNHTPFKYKSNNKEAL